MHTGNKFVANKQAVRTYKPLIPQKLTAFI